MSTALHLPVDATSLRLKSLTSMWPSLIVTGLATFVAGAVMQLWWQGWNAHFLVSWMQAWLVSWPIAFPLAYMTQPFWSKIARSGAVAQQSTPAISISGLEWSDIRSVSNTTERRFDLKICRSTSLFY